MDIGIDFQTTLKNTGIRKDNTKHYKIRHRSNNIYGLQF